MPKILTELRKCELGSLMAFRLTSGTEEVLNTTQLSEQAKQDLEASEGSDSSTLRATPDDLKLNSTNSIKKPFIPSLAPAAASTSAGWPLPPPQPPKEYEIYRVTNHTTNQKIITKSFSFLPFHTHENHSDTSYQITKLPASKFQIAEFMLANTAARPDVDDLLKFPPFVTTCLDKISTDKITRHVYMAAQWEVHAVIPLPASSSLVVKSRNPFKKSKGPEEMEYVIIISLPQKWAPGPPPPPPPGWRPSTKYGRGYMGSDNDASEAAEFKLSAQEIEDVVNGFLAGVTSLYDGVEVEERGRALKDAEWWVDSDSDASSSSGSRSLTDD
jgi:hypothetical protein